MEFGRVISHNILIEASNNNGFIVKVGCGRFAFSDTRSLIEALQEYLDNPLDVAKKYSFGCGEQPTRDEAEPPTYQGTRGSGVSTCVEEKNV